MRRAAIVALASAALAGIAVAAVLIAWPSSGSSQPEPIEVSSDIILDPSTLSRLGEADIVIIDDAPSDEPQLSLAEAVAEMEEVAGVTALEGALISVDLFPYVDAPAPDLAARLVWAVRVDPSATNIPELFDPNASVTVALIDANDGTLQTVLNY